MSAYTNACVSHTYTWKWEKITYEIVSMLLPGFSSEETLSSRVSRLLHDRKYLSSVFLVQWSWTVADCKVQVSVFFPLGYVPHYHGLLALNYHWHDVWNQSDTYRFFSSQITQLNCQEIHTLSGNRRTMQMFIWLSNNFYQIFLGCPKLSS